MDIKQNNAGAKVQMGIINLKMSALVGGINSDVSETQIPASESIQCRSISFEVKELLPPDVGVVFFDNRIYLIEEVDGLKYSCREIEFKEYKE